MTYSDLGRQAVSKCTVYGKITASAQSFTGGNSFPVLEGAPDQKTIVLLLAANLIQKGTLWLLMITSNRNIIKEYHKIYDNHTKVQFVHK